MAVDQLPGQVREFANYLDRLLARLDQGGGWCGVFWQRDPDGMQACLGGREIPPWDVVEALLQDLAAEYGPGVAAQEKERARALHAAALAAFDARPGSRDALGDRLDVMLREQKYAAERQAELGRLLGAATTQEEADALRLDLAWAHDDHERATARCTELRARIEELDKRVHLRGGGAIHRDRHGNVFRVDDTFQDQAQDGRSGGADPYGSYGNGPAPHRLPRQRDTEQSPGSGPQGGYGGPDNSGGGAYGGPDPLRHDEGVREARRGYGPAGDPTGIDRTESHPARRDDSAPDARRGYEDFERANPGYGSPAPLRDDFPSPAAAPAPEPSDWPATDAADWPAPEATRSAAFDPAQPEAPEPTQSTDPAPDPEAAPAPKQRKRRRGSARFAGMTEDDAAAAAPAPDPAAAVPELPTPASTARRTPRGARFAGAARPAERTQPKREALDAEARQATVEAVQRLVGLRREGRSGEAHALLAEAAYWPAARFPLLAAELQRAGLGADWATLLWEAASLPADRLVGAADALVAAGRTADGEQILRQGVARPAEEIGEAVLALVAEGRRREIMALLDAYVRVRTPEEAARSVAADPQQLVPLLVEAARGVSDERHWDLVHALRVAGFTA
ncbi:hypothetical protein [Streptomyces hokutonensis]|uniref:hypothetical protein n=1 Tax=Streptomyces hokutonensis TaxID=1306990 RepID=UPI00039BE530|nr:hypothetical protein [Streptomyces hokutonensis]